VRVAVVDGNGVSVSETASIAINGVTSLSASDVLNEAMSYVGSQWGSANCTGFVFTVSDKIGSPFYDLSQQAADHIGAYGGDPTQIHLLNDSHSNNSFDFSEPLSNIKLTASGGMPSGGVQLPSGYTSLVFVGSSSITTHVSSSNSFVFESSDAPGDHWNLVAGGGAGGQNVTTIDPNDPSTWPQAGDIFRGVVIERQSTNDGHDVITHAGVVSSYDHIHNTLTLIDNYPVHDGASTVPAVDTIGLTTFNIGNPGAGHPGILPGYFDIYHLIA